MFIRSVYGTNAMDEVLQDFQLDLLNGESEESIEEFLQILTEMRNDISRLNDEERAVQKVRVILGNMLSFCDDIPEFLMSYTLETELHTIMRDMNFSNNEFDSFIEWLAENEGHQVIDNVEYTYGTSFRAGSTIGIMMGFRRFSHYQKPEVLEHEIKGEVLYPILQDITDACVDVNSIQKYNLFDKIEQHINMLRGTSK